MSQLKIKENLPVQLLICIFQSGWGQLASVKMKESAF